MRLKVSVAGMAILLSLGFSAPAVRAAGDGSSGGTATCGSGEVFDKNQNKCVPKSSSLDTDTLYEAGRDLAYAGRHDEAIAVLSLAAERNDPRVLNFLGYSHRKQGKLLIALGYYEEAVRIDPTYTLVREYLGEAHLEMGDLASAREQLETIGSLCGTACAEYRELAGHIAAFEQSRS